MSDEVKRYIKFLASVRSSRLLRAAIQEAPDSVIKVISNAALNAQSGEIPLSQQQKTRFRKQKKLFNSLTTKKTSLKTKRRAILQRGGLAILPLILSTVLGAIGSALIEKRSK